jgi:formylmethanofuran dehydrogenase subunit A
MIVQAQKTKNWALIEVNLKRLYSLQKKYINLINIMDYEVKGTTLMLKDEIRVRNQFEKQWFRDVAERNNAYQEMKENIDKHFAE